MNWPTKLSPTYATSLLLVGKALYDLLYRVGKSIVMIGHTYRLYRKKIARIHHKGYIESDPEGGSSIGLIRLGTDVCYCFQPFLCLPIMALYSMDESIETHRFLEVSSRPRLSSSERPP